ncbi:MAG: OmpA family protein, partial [Treponema sp.]|nr:OmpA family protein [Treponema sp.]
MEKKAAVTALLAFVASAAFGQVQSQKFNLSDSEIETLASYESRGHVSEKDAVISSTSTINWAENEFSSKVILNVEKAGIPMPGGKSSSVNKIYMELPALVKDPLLSVFVDDANTLGDLILEGSLTIDELTSIIDNAHKTPVYFKDGTSRLVAEHAIQMQQIT